MTATALPPAVAAEVERGRAEIAARLEADAAELARRRERFGQYLDAVLGELPVEVAAWLLDRLTVADVSLATRRCVAEFGGLPRWLYLDADLTADGCEAVGWRVWDLTMREPDRYAPDRWRQALAAAVEPG